MTTILRTKLFPPPPGSGLVARPRLLERLSADRPAPVTLVCAPAGFGKTTLVAEWLRSESPPVAWVSLDEGDDDPVAFWSYVTAALDDAVPGCARDARIVLEAATPSGEDVAAALLNGVASAGPDVVLVLDDYHVITAEAVHGIIGWFLARLPPGMRVVLTTRTDPPLPLARMRARGGLVEIRQADLRFTRAEAESFLNAVMGLGLSSASVETLAQRTEGWAASLRLAALSMEQRTGGSRDAFIRQFAGDDRYVVDYLVDEVYGLQPPPVQRFLLRTSLLERLCAPLCAAVVDDAAAPSPDDIERAGLFLIPLDRQREWFRYHHLFRDLLRRRARGEVDSRSLLLRASAWCEAHDLIEEALHYAVAAPAPDRAAELLSAQFPAMLGRGEMRVVRRWLTALPAETVDALPELAIAWSYVHTLTGDPVAARPWIERATARVREEDLTPDDRHDLEGHLALLTAMAADEVAPVLASLEVAGDRFRGRDRFMAAVVDETLAGVRLALGDPEAARATALRSWELGSEDGNPHAAIIGVNVLGEALHALGRRGEGERFCRAALDEAATQVRTEGEHVLGHARLRLARLVLEADRVEEARDLVEETIRVTELAGADASLMTFAFAEAARVALAQGDSHAAADAIARGRALRPGAASLLADPLLRAVEVELLIAQGRLGRAAERLEAFPPEFRETIPARLVECAMLLARDSAPDAEALARRTLADAEARGAGGWAIAAGALHAAALVRLRRDRDALAALRPALLAASRESYVRTILGAGAALAPLLTRLAADRGRDLPDDARDFAARLAAMMESPGNDDTLLSEREIEILRLIAAGLSNRVIAERLFVTVGTVKRHSHNIYRKLDASRRTEAVARARELNLIR